MKLTHIRIKDFRSFIGDTEFAVSSGVNYLVGKNNTGKSNLIRALQLALDPGVSFDPDVDSPARDRSGGGAPRKTRITLSFQLGSTSPERTLRARAKAYELQVQASRGVAASTYAETGEIRFSTEFSSSGARVVSFRAKGQGAASLPVSSAEHRALLEQFLLVIRFAVVFSGDDLEKLLAGRFREILELVIKDHLSVQMRQAESSRQLYVDALQAQLLEPLRSEIESRVNAVFPEISAAELVPAVPTVSETLSSIEVRLNDSIDTALGNKGTGVRGAVLVSLLHYLAEQTKRSLVLAVEEPEAFLHPGAQETIKNALEELARRRDVSLLVTTHSPYVISHASSSSVTRIEKDASGYSSKSETLSGDAKRGVLLSSLYRDSGTAHFLESALSIPLHTSVVVVTEGFTDGEFIRQACHAAGKPELLDGVHFVPAGGASKVVVQAVLAESATEHPVIALLDHDDQGREAAKKLSSFGWSTKSNVLSLRAWPGSCKRSHDVEIEDLLPAAAVQRIVNQLGEDVAVDGKQKCADGGWHLQLSEAWKETAVGSLAAELESEKKNLGAMEWLAHEIAKRASALRVSKAKRLSGVT